MLKWPRCAVFTALSRLTESVIAAVFWVRFLVAFKDSRIARENVKPILEGSRDDQRLRLCVSDTTLAIFKCTEVSGVLAGWCSNNPILVEVWGYMQMSCSNYWLMGLPARSSATRDKLVNFGQSAIRKNKSTQVYNSIIDCSLKLSNYGQNGRRSLFSSSSLQWSQCREWSCVNEASQDAETEGDGSQKFGTEHSKGFAL